MEQLTRRADRPGVEWMPQKEHEGPAEYLRRALRTAQDVESQGGLTFRLGGKAQPAKVMGAPKTCTSEEVQQFLNEQGCTETEVVAQPTGKRGWLFKMTPPGSAHRFGYSLKSGENITFARCVRASPTPKCPYGGLAEAYAKSSAPVSTRRKLAQWQTQPRATA